MDSPDSSPVRTLATRNLPTPPPELAVPLEITDSVDYAKTSSDYLIGQAASVLHMVKDVRRQTIEVYMGKEDETGVRCSAQELTQNALALENAQKNLRRDFRIFDSDSTSWARFLRNGDRRDHENGGRPAVYLKEALAITESVNRARRHVQKACGQGI
ncbi:hypothetical protein LTR37_002102 [Vermiconidia calcicola]|uniref:Uncharacterized protein n=1 Tax=Vermiconidia calcicola TaxID=1690605 RepID=A0ACC3NTN1_9PEZI|nr:hypothetical protein LTR37_002102 [Vermiconidia calcicola]